jgi:cytoskeletal protein CcmA (bactofilin family)
MLAGVALLVAGAGLVAILAARAIGSEMPSSQTHNGNVSVYGQSTSIQGSIHGNLSVQNHATVTVTGRLTGWLRAYGTSTVIIGARAKVDGGILQSTGTLRIRPGAWIGTGLNTYNLSDQLNLGGHVAGQVRVSASGLDLGPQAQVAGGLWVWASPAQVVQVDGAVDGSVHVSGTDLHLGPTSHIGGSTSVYSGSVIHS